MMFAGPAVLVFAAVMVLPFLYGIFLTFTDWDGKSSQYSLVGLANYAAVFKDGVFWSSLLLTLRYAAFTVVLTNVVAFLLAYALSSGIKGSSFFRAGFFTPNLIGGIVLGLVWQFIFSRVMPEIGKLVGSSVLATSWLGDPERAFWAMVVVTVWQYSGYMMVIYIAGLTGVPTELIEAASIEGAGAWVKLKRIILPLLVPSIIICVFLTIQRSFMVYDLNLSLTGGGPYKSTALVSMNVYQTAFLSQQYGPGQAQAFFLFLIVAAVSIAQVYFGKKREVEL
jgi:raffinose/stachyose/melibiose transport system permease protein